ncbi:MAG: PorP/SprF family type IX secretion system membrane protein [Filimonas sp.]|nr:PorP/SprF family type IX secretion system membrane protein [Filimonas sp.]
MKRINKMIKVWLCVLCCTIMLHAKAQQAGAFGTGYFQNQYIFNPAMSGVKPHELNMNLSYAQQGKNLNDDRSFKTFYATGDYGFSDAVGAGLFVVTDKAGINSITKIGGTYSFHAKLGNDGQKLHLGITANGSWLARDWTKITGDPSDPSLYSYDKSAKFETDFGAAYTAKGFTLQAALPNMITLMSGKETPAGNYLNQSSFFAAASYKFNLNSDPEAAITVEPKVAYRTFRQSDNIFDGGLNVGFLKDRFQLYGIYHSSKSVTAGLQLGIIDAIYIAGSYTSQPSTLSGAFGNSFELAFRFNLAKKD